MTLQQIINETIRRMKYFADRSLFYYEWYGEKINSNDYEYTDRIKEMEYHCSMIFASYNYLLCGLAKIQRRVRRYHG